MGLVVATIRSQLVWSRVAEDAFPLAVAQVLEGEMDFAQLSALAEQNTSSSQPEDDTDKQDDTPEKRHVNLFFFEPKELAMAKKVFGNVNAGRVFWRERRHGFPESAVNRLQEIIAAIEDETGPIVIKPEEEQDILVGMGEKFAALKEDETSLTEAHDSRVDLSDLVIYEPFLGTNNPRAIFEEMAASYLAVNQTYESNASSRHNISFARDGLPPVSSGRVIIERGEVDPKRVVLDLRQIAAFGLLLRNEDNWNELVWMLRQHHIQEDGDQYATIRSRANALIEATQREEGRLNDNDLYQLAKKTLLFGRASTLDREEIIRQQPTEEGKFFFSLMLDFSADEIGYCTRVFHNRYISSVWHIA